MSLAYLARLDEYSLICDFAETYHVLSWRSLPARLAATLAVGLRDNSRIKVKASGATVSPELMLQAITADAVRLLVWQRTKDGAKSKNAPAMLTDMLSNKASEKESLGFDSPEAFMAWRASMLGGEGNA